MSEIHLTPIVCCCKIYVDDLSPALVLSRPAFRLRETSSSEATFYLGTDSSCTCNIRCWWVVGVTVVDCPYRMEEKTRAKTISLSLLMPHARFLTLATKSRHLRRTQKSNHLHAAVPSPVRTELFKFRGDDDGDGDGVGDCFERDRDDASPPS